MYFVHVTHRPLKIIIIIIIFSFCFIEPHNKKSNLIKGVSLCNKVQGLTTPSADSSSLNQSSRVFPTPRLVPY